jgi:hypothetical protein
VLYTRLRVVRLAARRAGKAEADAFKLSTFAVVNFGAKSPPSQRQQRGQFPNWNRFSFVFSLNVLQLSHFLTRLLTVAVTCHLSSLASFF